MHATEQRLAEPAPILPLNWPGTGHIPERQANKFPLKKVNNELN